MNYFKHRFNKLKKLDKRRKTYIIIIFLLICVMCWAFISATVITSTFNRTQVKNGESQKVNASGVIITETKNGTKYFEIYGESGSYNNQDKIAILNNPVGNFYQNNEVSMSFQSSKGTYDEETHVIKMYENTYIVLKDETSLEADSVTWYGSDKDTVAEGNVKIRKGKELLANADKCVIKAGYNSFKIIGKTKTQIFDKNKESK